jgi:autotransporter passenger strand-loop-strand repeat protein
VSEIVSSGVTSGSTTSVTSIGTGQADSSVTVLSGGTLLNTDLVSGGTGTFNNGAVVSGLVVSDNAAATLAGFASGVLVTATTDTRYGQLILTSGGVLSTALIDGAQVGSTSDTLLVISGGASANDVTMSYSGDVEAIAVSSGGSATNFTLLGGNMVVSAGGAIDTVTANTAGLVVEAGGLATSVTLTNRGFETVVSGGTTSDVTISSGGSQTIGSGSNASDVTVLSGGYEYVSSGGNAAGVFVSSGGTISVAQGGSASIATGSGGVIDDYGSLALTGAITGTTVDMEGTIGSTLTDTGAFTNGTFTATALASNFGAGDTIIIPSSDISGTLSSVFTGETYDNATGILSFTNAGDGQTFAIAIGPATAGTYSAADFTLSTSASGLDITTDIPCFCAGTSLLTIDGEKLVEDIAIGDEMVTLRDAAITSRKVVWTGRRAIDIMRHPQPALLRPVHIIAGAFGDNVPERDLRLSPLHAVYMNGCLFEAISLVNGTTIYQEQTTRYVTYYHIELDAHDIILAEGLPAETFLDTGDRAMFENISGVTILHPDFANAQGANFCAPLIRAGEQLDALRAELNGRANIRQWA